MGERKFSWVKLYPLIAKKLLDYKNNRSELINLLLEMKEQNFKIISLDDYLDKEKKRKTIRKDIDPFSFFSNLSRPIKEENRVKIVEYLLDKWQLDFNEPISFEGMIAFPSVRLWFTWNAFERGEKDEEHLWEIFEEAINGEIREKTYNVCLNVRGIKNNLSIGLHWVNPEKYLPLNKNTVNYLISKNILKSRKALNNPSFENYFNTLKKVKEKFPDKKLYEISAEAYAFAKGKKSAKIGQEEKDNTVSINKSDLYTIDSALKDLFIEKEKFQKILELLERKKNIVLQGPPGVGKTFIAKKLAYAFIGKKDEDKIETIQFHQSYSYEDFMQGYRPTESGGFELKNGPFYRFCEKAKNDPKGKYVFIVDEINRGNLSKIFGELMLLLEKDKRGTEYAISLTYSSERFYIPKNLYFIGTMNTADRSLAIVDYALRRRFAFVNLEPVFNDKFKKFLANNGVAKNLAERIVEKLKNLNERLLDDNSLGKDYLIGHSYFCPNQDDAAENFDESWFNTIIETEIEPLLTEYWFDDPKKAKDESSKLKL